MVRALKLVMGKEPTTITCCTTSANVISRVLSSNLMSYMRPYGAGGCGTKYARVTVLGQGFASDDRMQMACET